MRMLAGLAIGGIFYFGTCVPALAEDSSLSRTCTPLLVHKLDSGHVFAGCGYEPTTGAFRLLPETDYPLPTVEDLAELCAVVGEVSDAEPSYAFIAGYGEPRASIRCHIAHPPVVMH